MHIALTPSQEQLRRDLRAYIAGLVSDEVTDEIRGTEGGGPLYRRVMEQLGADGWLGIGWPADAGGQERSAVDQLIFFDEVQRAGFPLPFLTLATVGPTLIAYGTEEQKEKILPGILAGKIHFSIGYTEPSAGTDLASLTTRAVRDGDEYVVTGQKIFTSLAEYADYIWLAARTEPDAPKHKGISILMVDTRAPGFSLTPIETLGGNRTNTTYYEQVRVPVSMRVGPEHGGWKLITNQLNHERVALVAPGPVERFVEETIDWAQTTRRRDGTRPIDAPWVRANLARARATIRALRLMTWRQAWNIDRGVLDPAESSCIKVFGSEGFVEIFQLLMEVLGPASMLEHGAPGALLRGRLEMYYKTALVLCFGGGTNEIQRDIIAAAGLRMPRAAR